MLNSNQNNILTNRTHKLNLLKLIKKYYAKNKFKMINT